MSTQLNVFLSILQLGGFVLNSTTRLTSFFSKKRFSNKGSKKSLVNSPTETLECL